MRSTFASLIALLTATGCYSTMQESRGVTRASYAGTTQLVFTNATPQRMCNLSLSANADPSYGDNWLPKEGLASGASLELRVQPGTYKTTWSTCRDDFKQPFYAGTLFREFAFTIDRQEAQLYAFVSDSVVPTKRAATLGRQFQLVRAAGQKIDPSNAGKPAVASYAERQLMGDDAPTVASSTETKETAAAAPVPQVKVAKLDFHDCIDWKLAKTIVKKRPDAKPAPKAKDTKKRADVAAASPSLNRKVRTY